MGGRYLGARKRDEGRILDEAESTTGYDRCSSRADLDPLNRLYDLPTSSGCDSHSRECGVAILEKLVIVYLEWRFSGPTSPARWGAGVWGVRLGVRQSPLTGGLK